MPIGSSLDAEIWGCAMTIGSMEKCVDKWVKVCVLPCMMHIVSGKHCTRVWVVTKLCLLVCDVWWLQGVAGH